MSFIYLFQLNIRATHFPSAQVLNFGVKVNRLSWNVSGFVQPKFNRDWIGLAAPYAQRFEIRCFHRILVKLFHLTVYCTLFSQFYITKSYISYLL